MSRKRPYDVLKRILDIVASVVALVVGSPIMAVVAILVARKLGRPVLFRQSRPGRDGRVFTLLKFRTMRQNPPGRELPDDERLTRFGRALRATSLDELPSFVNVLRGEMSVVGPRPLLVSYLTRYTAEQARRHEVRPGITGLAQVSGRNTVEWERRFDLDVEYVERRSFALDARILLRTVRTAIARDGISAGGHATMPEFQPDGRA